MSLLSLLAGEIVVIVALAAVSGFGMLLNPVVLLAVIFFHLGCLLRFSLVEARSMWPSAKSWRSRAWRTLLCHPPEWRLKKRSDEQ